MVSNARFHHQEIRRSTSRQMSPRDPVMEQLSNQMQGGLKYWKGMRKEYWKGMRKGKDYLEKWRQRRSRQQLLLTKNNHTWSAFTHITILKSSSERICGPFIFDQMSQFLKFSSYPIVYCPNIVLQGRKIIVISHHFWLDGMALRIYKLMQVTKSVITVWIYCFAPEVPRVVRRAHLEWKWMKIIKTR